MKQTAVELLERRIMNTNIGSNGQMIFYHEELKRWLDEAISMENKQREECFIEGYKNRALLSNLIFDAASELFAKSLFEQNQTFKSE